VQEQLQPGVGSTGQKGASAVKQEGKGEPGGAGKEGREDLGERERENRGGLSVYFQGS
jgi:hypothetical protein